MCVWLWRLCFGLFVWGFCWCAFWGSGFLISVPRTHVHHQVLLGLERHTQVLHRLNVDDQGVRELLVQQTSKPEFCSLLVCWALGWSGGGPPVTPNGFNFKYKFNSHLQQKLMIYELSVNHVLNIKLNITVSSRLSRTHPRLPVADTWPCAVGADPPQTPVPFRGGCWSS